MGRSSAGGRGREIMPPGDSIGMYMSWRATLEFIHGHPTREASRSTKVISSTVLMGWLLTGMAGYGLKPMETRVTAAFYDGSPR
jgi:hypothetical protein